jgi:hypothetical protein
MVVYKQHLPWVGESVRQPMKPYGGWRKAAIFDRKAERIFLLKAALNNADIKVTK